MTAAPWWCPPATNPGADRGPGSHLPYDRPSLSKVVVGVDGPLRSPTHRTADELAGLGIEIRLGSAATALDLDSWVVHIGADAVAYDRLVPATGAHARTVPGAQAPSTSVPYA